MDAAARIANGCNVIDVHTETQGFKSHWLIPRLPGFYRRGSFLSDLAARQAGQAATIKHRKRYDWARQYQLCQQSDQRDRPGR